MSQQQQNVRLRTQIYSSGAGALATSLFMTPLDVIKVRLQIQPKRGQKFFYCNGLMDCLCIAKNGKRDIETWQDYYKRCWYRKPLPSQYKNTLDAAFQIVKTEGLRSLWSGLAPTIIQSTISVCLYFTLYEHLRNKFRQTATTDFQKNFIAVPLAGSSARVSAVILINPVEVIRTRMQADPNSSFSQIFKQLLKNPKQFHSGFYQTILRDVPFTIIYWTINERLRNDYLLAYPQLGVFSRNFTAGAFAGCIAALVTHPFDVMKTRQQTLTQPETNEIKVKSFANSKMDIQVIDCTDVKINNTSFSYILKNEGWKVLFSGVKQRLFRTSGACAIMLGSYEFTRTLF